MAKKFAVIGGDNRIVYLIKALKEDGHIVDFYGFDKKNNMKNSKTLQGIIEDSDYVISGIPFSKDGKTIHASFSSENIMVEDVFKFMTDKQVLLAGYITEPVVELAEENHVQIIDLFKKEELAIAMAIPTAEGAIKIAIEKTEFTLFGSKVLVIGYGRVGKILSKMLLGLGANVTIVTKDEKDILIAKDYGYYVYDSKMLDLHLGNKDIIFNTAPVTQITKKNMMNLKNDVFIVDVSSAPFGINYDDSLEFDIKVFFAASLPGIVAPLTVGLSIRDTIYGCIFKSDSGEKREGLV